MDNQYNYYDSGGDHAYNGNQRYTGRPYGGEAGQEPAGSGRRSKGGASKVLAVTGLAILFGIVASAVFLVSNIVGNHILGNSGAAGASSASSDRVGGGTSLSRSSSVVTSDVSEVVDKVMPSVVSITSMSVEEVQSFFGGTYARQSAGAGTGIIIGESDTELLIVTNDHVVSGSDTLTVTFNDETSVEANIKGTDPEYDVAVIAVPLASVSAETRDAISVATLGDSTNLKVGEPAIAIGNALGYGQSVTTGVISALGRSAASAADPAGETNESKAALIQTDAAINEGNSGGALVNVNGEVIGINSAKLIGESVEGIGYAIPVSDVSELIQSLMSRETKTKVDENSRGMIGIRGISVSDAFSQQIDMPAGVYVTDITAGGGAAEAGMTKGCIITDINGSPVDSMDALQTQLEYYAKGETVTLTVQIPQSNGRYEEKTVGVTLN